MRIRGSRIFILLLIVPWFFPAALNIIFPSITSIVNAWKCIGWFAILLISLYKKKVSRFTVALHITWLVFFFCSMVADYSFTNVNTWLTSFCSICGLALLFDKFGADDLTGFLFKYFYILALVNLIVQLVRPEGFDSIVWAYDGLNSFAIRSNFLCTDNMYGPFMMSLFLLNELTLLSNSHKKYRLFVYLSCWGICITSALLMFSGTCIVGLIVICVWKLVTVARIKKPTLRIWHLAAFLIAAFVGVYYFNIQKLFSVLIVNILGKDLTLTRRLGLWANAIDMIREKLLIGWGCKNKGSIILREYYYWYAHNLILDILLEGGMITLVLYGFMLKSLAKHIKETLSDKRIQVCMEILFAFVVMNIAESHFHIAYFYLPMILAAKIGDSLKRGA